MNRLIFCFIVLLAGSTAAQAQNQKAANGTVKGIITTSDGKAAANVNVAIEHTNNGTTTSEGGEYSIKIKPGNYTLHISSVNTAPQQKQITVMPAQTLQVDFVLKESSTQLEEVIISSRSPNKVNSIVAKIPLKNLENPQVYNTVSLETMKQQVITNYDDAFRNIPGITRTWESTGRAGDGASYFALRGFDAQPLLYNGLPGLTSGNLDPANIQEIQVLKGPSGTLFGGGFYSYGGIINTITKKPYHDFGGEVAYSFGSFGLNRVTADFNTPLSKKDKVALRVTTAYHSENSFQDAGFKKSFFIAPTLAYQVNDKLSLHFLSEILEEERAVAPVFFQSDRFSPLDFKTVDELNLNNNLSFTSNDLTIRNPRFNLQAQALYQLSKQWTSQTVVSRGSVRSNGIYTYIWDDVAGDNWFSQYFHNENQITNTTDIQQNFNGDFTIGNLRNRLVVGLEYFDRNVVENGSGWAWGRNVTPQGDVNYTDPFSGTEMEPVQLNAGAISNLLATTESSPTNIKNSSYGAYFSNVLNITSNVMAMVSGRADYFDSKGDKNTAGDEYSQWAFSPKFGLVYQPVLDKVSLFANYMNAFINVAPQEVFDGQGTSLGVKSFKPEHANQSEIGVKTNLFANKLYATASFYDIEVSNRVLYLPTGPMQGGRIGSKGFELDINANPFARLNLIAGYSFNETKVLEGNKEDFYAEAGRSPGGQGPQHLANLWASYKFGSRDLEYFGIGAGGNYGSTYRVIDNSVTGVFDLPSYLVLNGSVFYNAEEFRISLNVNNLANEQYYTGYWSINPQKRRNFAASVAYKF
jgi:iron complex outermembrane receptor protein